MPPSVFDEDTEYVLERSDSPVSVDGVPLNAPTGMVTCEECGATAENIDEIPHDADCGQRFAKSQYWRQSFLKQ